MESPEACASEMEDSGIKKVEEMGLEKMLWSTQFIRRSQRESKTEITQAKGPVSVCGVWLRGSREAEGQQSLGGLPFCSSC